MGHGCESDLSLIAAVGGAELEEAAATGSRSQDMGEAPDDGGKSCLWLIAAVGGAELEEAAAAEEGEPKVMVRHTWASGDRGPGDGAPGTTRTGLGGKPDRGSDLRAGGQGADLVRELEEATGGPGLWLIACL